MKTKFTRTQIILSVLSAALLIGAASSWLLSPGQADNVFGVPLEGRSFPVYGIIKGIEDLLPAIMTLIFLWQKNRQALRTALAVSILVPVVDIWLVYHANGFHASLLTHVLFIALPLLAVYTLQRKPLSVI